ncbi:MAG: hypothetical protein HUU57_02045 [Bdellovibrio sp.]|nr:hypothetical protein [Bdellovibrio sp.]
MPLRVKRSKFRAGLRNNRGQAVVEYVLLVIISVSLVLALMNVIFKPFGEFIDNYMGRYVACLLEYGELPTLGGDTPSEVDEDSECNKKFQPGSLAAGRPPNDNGGGASSDSSKSQGSDANSDGASGGGSSSTYAGSNSRGGSNQIGGRGRRSVGTESSDAPQGKVVESALSSGPNGAFFNSRNSYEVAQQGRKVSSVPLSGLSEAERKKIAKKKEKVGQTVSSNEGFGPAPKKIPVKPPPQKTELEEIPPMTIGNFIRYLFIAALVIALVIFIGGQALQMSKSGEK